MPCCSFILLSLVVSPGLIFPVESALVSTESRGMTWLCVAASFSVAGLVGLYFGSISSLFPFAFSRRTAVAGSKSRNNHQCTKKFFHIE